MNRNSVKLSISTLALIGCMTQIPTGLLYAKEKKTEKKAEKETEKEKDSTDTKENNYADLIKKEAILRDYLMLFKSKQMFILKYRIVY